MSSSAYIGRFAPSPSGRIHAGNIFALLCAWLDARLNDGEIVLRVEDLDTARCKQEHIDLLYSDLELLELDYDRGPYFQSSREQTYQIAFELISKVAHVYPCFCSRADLKAASAPHVGESLVYAGTCRLLTDEEISKLQKTKSPAFRVVVPGGKANYLDDIQGEIELDYQLACGDFILRRSDGSFAYNLAVVVDDNEQGVNHIVRGCDLTTATLQQLFLYETLGYSIPSYAHIPLLVSADGRRLAKRDNDASLDFLLDYFESPQAIIGHIAYIAGFIDRDEALSVHELLNELEGSSISEWLNGTSVIKWTI